MQAGIDSAAVGDTVLVDCGVYLEHTIRMKSGITLRGVSRDCVEVDAQGLGRVLILDNLSQTTVIEEITFRNGYVSHGKVPPSRGGGAFATGCLDLSISRCAFVDNEASSFGGAVYAEYSNLVVQRRLD